MLNLNLIEDENKIRTLQKELYGMEINGATVGLMMDGKLIGISTFTIGDTAHIKAVAIYKEQRKNGYGDFLTRSLMNMLTLSGLSVTVDYEDKNHYFDKFNFKMINDKLTVKAEEIVFPCSCHKE
jgi:N-acetylglutamate synthase-like GNAT family acetyltransferase